MDLDHRLRKCCGKTGAVEPGCYRRKRRGEWYFTERDGEPLATEADLLLQTYLENHVRILVPDLFLRGIRKCLLES